jgi:hypothetical protein
MTFMTVSLDLTFAERITRGNYSWINSDLTEKKFPVTKDQNGEWEWKLFHFNPNTSFEETIRLIQKDGFEPAKTGHILTFGEINPEEQRKYRIIGLGSVARVVLLRSVPVLWSAYGRRFFDLYWLGHGWNYDFRFLGVRRRSVLSGA